MNLLRSALRRLASLRMTHHRQFAALLLTVALGATMASAAPSAVLGVIAVPAGFTAADYVSIGQRLTAMAWAPDGRLFVSEKAGKLRVVKNGALRPDPFLTLPVNSVSERGLLGVAFDPNFGPSAPYVYVFYTYAGTIKNRVSRFSVSATDPDIGDLASELILLDDIPSDTGGHNGGALHFGPDGKLYASIGDSGTGANSQDLGSLAGKLLRINRDGTVPADNPFVGQAGRRAEVWAYGLRNPYTFAFQSGTGRLFINDVGNNTWEEVNEGARAANYGWPTCEGPCSNPNFVNPIYSYRHDAGPGKAITGAAFYTGRTFPAEYANDYFFGDYVGHYIKRYDMETGQVIDFATDATYPVDIRTGPDGALYYLSVEAKKVVRIQYTGSAPPGQNEVSLVPIADDHTASGSPGTNYGKSPLLYIQSANVISKTYMKWDLTALAGKQVLSAALRFHTANASAAGSNSTQTVKLVEDESWSELALTYDNQPALSTMLATIGQTAPNTNYAIPLAIDPVQAHIGGLFSIGIDSPGPRDNMYFHSRDNATDKPTLLIQYATPPPPVVGEVPEPNIDLPIDGTTYRAGDEISYSGSATDPEDGPLDPAHLTWEVDFHHDTHTHPLIEPYSGATGGMFTVPDSGEPADNTWYRIHLTATDADGNESTVFRDVVPLKARVTIDTVPSGLTILLDGSPVVAPSSFIGVQGFKRQLTAPTAQTLNGHTYQFQSWSDDGAADHTITTPELDTIFTGAYRDVTDTGGVVASDGFERSVSGGWGTAEIGGSYTAEGTASGYNVANGQGRMVLPMVGSNLSTVLHFVSLRDADVKFRVSSNKLATGGAEYAYADVRRVGNNMYRPKVIFNTNGSVSVHCGVVVSGTESSVAPAVTVPGLAHATGAFYWVRATITGQNPTTINVKAWADGQPEPASWQYTATNSAASVQGAGAVGLRAYSRSTNPPITFSFDDYQVNATPVPPDPPPPGGGTILAQDAFGRTATSGWAVADTGGAYTTAGTAANFSVANNVGRMTLPAGGANRSAYLNAVSGTDVDARVRITADKSTVGGSWYAYLVLRRNANNAYQPKLIANSNGTVSVQAGLLANGAESSLGSAVVVPGLTSAPNAFIWLRAQVSGTGPTTIKVKAWADGQTEPSSWQFTATNSNAAVQSGGSFGLRGYISGGVSNVPIVLSFDDYLVTALP